MSKAVEIELKQAGELALHWQVLIAAFIGLLFSSGPLIVYSFGVFFQPLSAEFNWSRTEIAGALTVSQFALAVAGPVHGYLIDKLGVRPLLFFSIVSLGLALGSLYWLSPSLIHLYLCFILMNVLGTSASPLGYSRIIVGLFDRRRGLALGIALSGVGMGAMVFPPLVQQLISDFGWRSAYLALGIAALIPLLFNSWLFNSRNAAPEPSVTPLKPFMVNSTPQNNVRNFIVLSIIFIAMGTVTVGVFAHFIPLLTDSGIARGDAAWLAGIIGLAVVLGRAGIGWLIDMIHAPFVMSVIAFGLMLACWLLSMYPAGVTLWIAAVLLGLGLGAEVDLLSFLVSRYWPARLFGTIYGPLFGMFMIGAGLGPLVIGLLYDWHGDYQYALNAAAGCALLVAVFCLLLPKYAGRAD